MSPNDSLKNRTAGRTSLITTSSDSGDITLQKKGKADLSSTTTSESVDLEPKVELKQKRGRGDSAAPKGRADSAATLKSTDIDMRHKRKSLDPPHTLAPNADDISPSAASVSVSLTRTILIGESTVEWFSRILDPDGESEGDIVGMGKVTFVSRNSNVRLYILLSYLLPHRPERSLNLLRTILIPFFFIRLLTFILYLLSLYPLICQILTRLKHCALYLHALDFDYNHICYHFLSVDQYSNFCLLTIQLMIGLLNSWTSSILDLDSELLMTRPALPLSFDNFNELQNQSKGVGFGKGRGRAVNEWLHRFESVDDDDDDEEDDNEDDD